MKKYALAFLVLAGMILLAFYSLTYGRFPWESSDKHGFSADNPLGAPDRIAGMLEPLKTLSKTVKDRPDGLKEVVYLDEKSGSKTGGFKEEVVLIMEPNGKLRGVGGHFIIANATGMYLPNTASCFLREYWKARSGQEQPDFTTISSGSGMFRKKTDIAKFSVEGVEGVWEKPEDSPFESIRIYAASSDETVFSGGNAPTEPAKGKESPPTAAATAAPPPPQAPRVEPAPPSAPTTPVAPPPSLSSKDQKKDVPATLPAPTKKATPQSKPEDPARAAKISSLKTEMVRLDAMIAQNEPQLAKERGERDEAEKEAQKEGRFWYYTKADKNNRTYYNCEKTPPPKQSQSSPIAFKKMSDPEAQKRLAHAQKEFERELKESQKLQNDKEALARQLKELEPSPRK